MHREREDRTKCERSCGSGPPRLRGYLLTPRVAEYAGVGLTAEASAFAAVAAVVVVAIPWLRRLEIRWSLVLVLLLFAADRILIGEAVGEVPLQEFLSLAYVSGAVVLANRSGRRDAGVGRKSWMNLAPGPRTSGSTRSSRARRRSTARSDVPGRHDHPVALMALSVSGADAPLRRLVQEMQREVTEKFAAAQVSKLLLHETDAGRGGHAAK